MKKHQILILFVLLILAISLNAEDEKYNSFNPNREMDNLRQQEITFSEIEWSGDNFSNAVVAKYSITNEVKFSN